MKKTFKLLLSAAILFSATLSANAQLLKKENFSVPDPMHFGVRGGVNFNTFTHYETYAFPTAGVALDYKLTPTAPIFIGTGLSYVNYVLADGRELDEYQSTLHIPVTLSYHINVAPHLFINPFAGFFGAYYLHTTFDESLNYGFRIGCGMNFKRLTFDVAYDAGLASHKQWESEGLKSSTVFLTVGFNFVGKR